MWFLTGLPDQRVGLFMKMHHAIADGVAGVATLAAFLDPVPDPPGMGAPGWSPSPLPSARELFRDNLRRRRRELGRAFSALARPAVTARRLRRSWPAARELFAEGRAPRTSVNRRIGSDRRLAVIRGPLDVAKNIAHIHGATVNKVLMTAVAAGYAALLSSRGEPISGVVLRAFVPISLHQEQPGQAGGNVDAGMLVPLPIGERDEIRRLQTIAAETTERKKKIRPPAGSMFRTVLRAFLRLMPRQRFMNAYVANVPAPRSRCTSPAPPFWRSSRSCPSPGTSLSASARSPTPGSSTSRSSPTVTFAQTTRCSPTDCGIASERSNAGLLPRRPSRERPSPALPRGIKGELTKPRRMAQPGLRSPLLAILAVRGPKQLRAAISARSASSTAYSPAWRRST
jgi:hypothetical protein